MSRTDPRDVIGLVEKANGGLLILEEIGELPLEVQSMLLTFVETGEYRRVGDTDPEPRKSNVRIVGATNRENALRKDFRYRFFPFNVPPIYERRVDVLYYLANRFPELIESLSPMEAFAFLAHHWPGSVREIERVGRLLQRKMELIKPDFMKAMFKLPLDSIIADVNFVDPARLLQLDRHDTSLDVTQVVDLYDRMKEGGVNVKALEIVLSHFNVGLNVRSKKRFFSTFKKLATVPEMSPTNDTSIVISKSYDPFEKALRGYSLFCSIFFQKPEGEKGNFDVSTPSTIEFYINLEKLPPALRKKCQTIMNEVFEFLSGIKLPKGVNIPEIYAEREVFFENIIKQYPDNEFMSAISKLIPFKTTHDTSNTTDIFSMKYIDFNKYYYEGLKSRWGTFKKAANILNISASTLYGKRAKNRKDSLIK